MLVADSRRVAFRSINLGDSFALINPLIQPLDPWPSPYSATRPVRLGDSQSALAHPIRQAHSTGTIGKHRKGKGARDYRGMGDSSIGNAPIAKGMHERRVANM